ncbi:LIRP-like [Chrysoperla carnea]|uniref:LIRP-like n=1 Tax=Chrysoperla carnea TaxID=189513 RepID=UPI001D0888D3|nr:LIRP-like [Chrysoperla carnea]
MAVHYWSLIISIICLVIIINDVQSDLFDPDDIISAPGRMKRTRRLCGTVLANTIQLVCRGSGTVPVYKKSDSTEYEYQEDDDNSIGTVDFDIKPVFPFRSKMNAEAMYPRIFRRPRRSIIDECCRKPCTIDELRQYCY